MYSCVVVGFDGSEASRKALGKAATLSRIFRCRLIVVTVLPRVSITLGEMLVPELVDSSRVKKFAEQLLEDIAHELQRAGVADVRYHVVEGDPVTSILELAKREGCNLVVVGKRGKASKFWGSVSRGVVGRAQGLDVLVVAE